MRKTIPLFLILLAGCAAYANDPTPPSYDHGELNCAAGKKCFLFTADGRVQVPVKEARGSFLGALDQATAEGWEIVSIPIPSIAYLRRLK